jgi:shikimate dehydrogenase
MIAGTADPPIVNGATRLFGILGDPIEQVKSPEEITRRFRARGANALCLPIHARPGDFDAVLRGLKATVNYDGFILTVPHKIRAMSYVDKLLPRAVRVGAVNVVRRERNGTWTGSALSARCGRRASIRRASVQWCSGRAAPAAPSPMPSPKQARRP